MHLLLQAIWGNNWKYTRRKSQTNATNATMHPLRHAVWGDMWKRTVEKSKKKCNQCDYVFSYASALRRHLKKHSGEVKQMLPVWLCILSGNPFEDTSQCHNASSNASSLMIHLKSHRGEKSNKWNQCSVTMDPIMQVIWGSIWKCTVEKN